MTTPRGIRLNNPGNIRCSNIQWEGKLDPSNDPDFETFQSPQFGIRAIAVILRNYHVIAGLSTIAEYISRWAPARENDTAAYTQDVCGRCDSAPDAFYDVLDWAKLADLVSAIICHENGGCPYDEETITAGVQMAFGPIQKVQGISA